MQLNDYETLLNQASEQIEQLLQENQELRQTVQYLKERIETLSESDLELQKSRELKDLSEKNLNEQKNLQRQNLNKSQELQNLQSTLADKQSELDKRAEELDKADKTITNKQNTYNKRFSKDLRERQDSVIKQGIAISNISNLLLCLDFVFICLISEQISTDILDFARSIYSGLNNLIALYDQNTPSFIVALIFILILFIGAVWGIYKLISAIIKSNDKELLKLVTVAITNTVLLIRSKTSIRWIWLLLPLSLGLAYFFILVKVSNQYIDKPSNKDLLIKSFKNKK